MLRAALSLAFAFSFSLSAQSLSKTQWGALAPTGTLRAAFLGDNPVLGRVDAKTGAVTGPVADLVKELARRMDLPYTLIPASGARDIIDRLKAHTADIGFMAYNAGRAQDVDFSAPWLLMPSTYIVLKDSPIKKTEDADREGVLIGASKNDTQDVYLSAHLKNAHLNRLAGLPAPEEIQKMLKADEVGAFAANRQRLIEIADNLPELRVVEDSFSVAGQAIATAKGNDAQASAINSFLENILPTDFVKSAIARAKLRGVDAAAVKTDR